MKIAEIPGNESERLEALYQLDILNTPEEQEYDDLTFLAAQICGTPIAIISLVDRENQFLKSHYGIDDTLVPRDACLCPHAILDDDLTIIEDTLEDERFHDNPLVTGAPNIRFYAGAPLIFDNNIRLGTLSIADRRKRELTEHQKKTLQVLARQVVSLLKLRKNMQDLKTAHAVLKDDEQRLALHVKRTPLGVIEWNREFEVTSWNPSAETIFNYKETEVLGKHAKEIILPDSVVEHVDNIWEQLLSMTSGFRSTNENITSDGRTILCEWYNTPLINEDNEVIGVTSLVQDITKQHNDENELTRAKNEAEKANRAKTAFLTNMSHELRTPLNAIIGFSQLLHMDENLSETQKDNVREISTSGHHLLSIINDILDLSKIEAEKIELLPGYHNHITLAEECLRTVEHLSGQQEITLTNNLSENGTVINVDSTRFKQILMNLLTNAIKYNYKGGNVSIDDKIIDGNTLRITVTDTGPGISEEDKKRLFSPFQRLGEYKGIDGTGIGLVISKNIAELMGGKLGMDSEPGKGSRFWLDFPVCS